MTKLWMGVIIIVALISAIALTYVSRYNQAVSYESEIVALDRRVDNVLSQYSLKVSEMVQVTDMYKDDFNQIVKDQMRGRYGENGSGAVMQWLKEHNVALDSKVYTNLQITISGGRDKVENVQSKLLDTKRSYTVLLNSFLGGMMVRSAGFPRIDLDDYDIIESQYSKDARESGIDSGLQLR